MKNLIINPDVSVDKERNEVNDKIDHALINWLIKNSYNPIIISNETLILSKKKNFKPIFKYIEIKRNFAFRWKFQKIVFVINFKTY